MNLTAQNVNDIFSKCLFAPNEDTSNYIPAKAVMTNVGFNPIRIEENKPKIIEMLNDLPSTFKTSGNGGNSFLNLCNDKYGNQWADLHKTIDQLLCLGIAIDKIEFPMPREMWSVLPGGMPYVQYKDK